MMHSAFEKSKEQFFKKKLSLIALIVLLLFCFIGIYAPFLASSKPFIVRYNGEWYFPLFRYLFYKGFYTKNIDLFFNLMMFTVPLFLIALYTRLKSIGFGALFFQSLFFLYLALRVQVDPAADVALMNERQEALKELKGAPSWAFQLKYMTPYAQLNQLVRYRLLKEQTERLEADDRGYVAQARIDWLDRQVRRERLNLLRRGTPEDKIPSQEELKGRVLKSISNEELKKQLAIPTLYNQQKHLNEEQLELLQKALQKGPNKELEMKIISALAKQQWYEEESQKLSYMVMPLVRSFHWEDDAGGNQSLNRYISSLELTRINRKDMVAALLFGVRISLVVGILAVSLALLIGVPVGAVSGYYGGKVDIVVCRLLEIWESMPVFFMLLLVVALLQNKSIFLVIAVIGLFGWTGFARYVRGEFFKQRNLPYVEACFVQGFSDRYIIFSHILPNAIPPLLTLLPFAVMSAITSEAALSFLGLGEEGSSSWGVLMDEGRHAFPGESYLLWPPAILLTTLLIAIALVGDGLRDALDPKLND